MELLDQLQARLNDMDVAHAFRREKDFGAAFKDAQRLVGELRQAGKATEKPRVEEQRHLAVEAKTERMEPVYPTRTYTVPLRKKRWW